MRVHSVPSHYCPKQGGLPGGCPSRQVSLYMVLFFPLYHSACDTFQKDQIQFTKFLTEKHASIARHRCLTTSSDDVIPSCKIMKYR